MSHKMFAAAAGAMLMASCVVAGPVAAQGFFDQLFGRPAAPVYNQPDLGIFPNLAPPAPYVPRRKKTLVDAKPVLQKPTDLMHDRTLRVGDAVMMKGGLRIYNGGDGESHSARQFVRLDDSDRVSSTKRAELAALDVTRSETLHEGRSSTDVVRGFQITDARGNAIRYVGP